MLLLDGATRKEPMKSKNPNEYIRTAIWRQNMKIYVRAQITNWRNIYKASKQMQ